MLTTIRLSRHERLYELNVISNNAQYSKISLCDNEELYFITYCEVTCRIMRLAG